MRDFPLSIIFPFLLFLFSYNLIGAIITGPCLALFGTRKHPKNICNWDCNWDIPITSLFGIYQKHPENICFRVPENIPITNVFGM